MFESKSVSIVSIALQSCGTEQVAVGVRLGFMGVVGRFCTLSFEINFCFLIS